MCAQMPLESTMPRAAIARPARPAALTAGAALGLAAGPASASIASFNGFVEACPSEVLVVAPSQLVMVQDGVTTYAQWISGWSTIVATQTYVTDAAVQQPITSTMTPVISPAGVISVTVPADQADGFGILMLTTMTQPGAQSQEILTVHVALGADCGDDNEPAPSPAPTPDVEVETTASSAPASEEPAVPSIDESSVLAAPPVPGQSTAALASTGALATDRLIVGVAALAAGGALLALGRRRRSH